MSADNIAKLLELYQQSRERGEWARLNMETMNGQDFITFSVKSPAGSPAKTGRTWRATRQKKTPSQLRRDQKRKEVFLAKKDKATNENVETSASDPEKVMLAIVEPKLVYEIDPEEIINENSSEIKVYGEYKYSSRRDFKSSLKNYFGDIVTNIKYFETEKVNEKVQKFLVILEMKIGFGKKHLEDTRYWPDDSKILKMEG